MKRSVLQKRAREMGALEGLKKMASGPLEPMKKKAPPGMEPIARLKALEDAERKKSIIRRLSVLEKVLLRKAKNQRIKDPDTRGYYLGMRKTTRELKEKIKQEGITPETARMLGSPEYNKVLIEDAIYHFTPKELEFRFRKEKQKIFPSAKINPSKHGRSHPGLVLVPPIGVEEIITIDMGRKAEVKAHVPSTEIAAHELQHLRTEGLGLSLAGDGSRRGEFYSILRTLNEGHYKNAFLNKFGTQIGFERGEQYAHEYGAKYALIANKMGIKVKNLEDLWEKKKGLFSKDSKRFANNIFETLDWADNELKKKELNESEIKKKLREKLRNLRP